MLIFYTAKFIPKPHQAATRGPVIFIHPDYKADKGLLAHEKIHRKQWLRTLGLHSLLYLLVPEYRLAAEVEAFREQAEYYPDDRRPLFAKFIAEKYALQIAPAAALRLLT